MIKFHQKDFIESIPFEDVNSDQLRHSNYRFRNIHNMENKLTRFQIYPETEVACKSTKLKPQDKDSTRLQELSLMNNTHFGAIRYDIHLDMKLDYTISRIFHEMSLTELERLHQLCEILQSLALAVLKISYAGYLLSGNRSNFSDYKGNILWYNTCTKKYHLYMFLKTKDAMKESQYFTKVKYILLIHALKEFILIQQFHVEQKIATM